jgi:hypothetical protein
LRYLTKHVAFKEEQECRIIKIAPLTDANVKPNENYTQLYMEYANIRPSDVKEICFGPHATGLELYEDILANKHITIPCRQSKNPLA